MRELWGCGETYGSAVDGGKRQVRQVVKEPVPLPHGCLMLTRVGMADKRAARTMSPLCHPSRSMARTISS